MNLDNFPLGMFEVDCDGSACGSGHHVGIHVHGPQYTDPAPGRVVVRDNQRISYSQAVPGEDSTP